MDNAIADSPPAKGNIYKDMILPILSSKIKEKCKNNRLIANNSNSNEIINIIRL